MEPSMRGRNRGRPTVRRARCSSSFRLTEFHVRGDRPEEHRRGRPSPNHRHLSALMSRPRSGITDCVGVRARQVQEQTVSLLGRYSDFTPATSYGHCSNSSSPRHRGPHRAAAQPCRLSKHGQCQGVSLDLLSSVSSLRQAAGLAGILRRWPPMSATSSSLPPRAAM
jgi:hypothetical protein